MQIICDEKLHGYHGLASYRKIFPANIILILSSADTTVHM